MEHGVPEFGTTVGQPGVAGGGAQFHFGGGGMQGPARHDVHAQIVASPTTQTSPSVLHTAPSSIGGAHAPGGGIGQRPFVVSHSPPEQVQSLRHAGSGEVP
jgi:hypothetical protein